MFQIFYVKLFFIIIHYKHILMECLGSKFNDIFGREFFSEDAVFSDHGD